jgi:hypothetical protein
LRLQFPKKTESVSEPDVTVDLIIHVTADIRYYTPENDMIRANVSTIANMIKLADNQASYWRIYPRAGR